MKESQGGGAVGRRVEINQSNSSPALLPAVLQGFPPTFQSLANPSDLRLRVALRCGSASTLATRQAERSPAQRSLGRLPDAPKTRFNKPPVMCINTAAIVFIRSHQKCDSHVGFGLVIGCFFCPDGAKKSR